MDEVIPLPAGLVDENIAKVATLAPVLSDLVTVERNRELLTRERDRALSPWHRGRPHRGWNLLARAAKG
jgi:hypothetical protein